MTSRRSTDRRQGRVGPERPRRVCACDRYCVWGTTQAHHCNGHDPNPRSRPARHRVRRSRSPSQVGGPCYWLGGGLLRFRASDLSENRSRAQVGTAQTSHVHAAKRNQVFRCGRRDRRRADGAESLAAGEREMRGDAEAETRFHLRTAGAVAACGPEAAAHSRTHGF